MERSSHQVLSLLPRARWRSRGWKVEKGCLPASRLAIHFERCPVLLAPAAFLATGGLSCSLSRKAGSRVNPVSIQLKMDLWFFAPGLYTPRIRSPHVIECLIVVDTHTDAAIGNRQWRVPGPDWFFAWMEQSGGGTCLMGHWVGAHVKLLFGC